MTSSEYLQQLVKAQIRPSILLGCPGFNLDMVAIDWLHTVDLGVSQDMIGCLLIEAAQLEEGNKSSQLQRIWSKIRAYYAEVKPPSQLDNLTFDMLVQPGKSPKLKAKGGETRYLVPFAKRLAEDCYERAPTQHWQTVRAIMRLLLELYEGVAQVPYDPETGAEKCRRMCSLYQCLATEAVENGVIGWIQKPKLHLMQELLEYSVMDLGSPQNFWCYRDEAWVGWLGKAAHRRGGKDGPSCAATRALQRYRALANETMELR